jgi:hypothetical protein
MVPIGPGFPSENAAGDAPGFGSHADRFDTKICLAFNINVVEEFPRSAITTSTVVVVTLLSVGASFAFCLEVSMGGFCSSAHGRRQSRVLMGLDDQASRS